MKLLYLIRGLPGSGITTLATMIKSQYHGLDIAPVHLEDVNWMKNADGQFVFARSVVYSARKICLERTRNYLFNSFPVVIVANNFVKKSDITGYLDAAKEFNYKVIIFECHGRFKTSLPLPEEILNRLSATFYPTELLVY